MSMLRRLYCRLFEHRWHTWTDAHWVDQHGQQRHIPPPIPGPYPVTICDRCGDKR